MKISDLRALLKNKEVIEEINKHLWIESQKAGYSIGIERATDEWLKLYAAEWMKYHMPETFEQIKGKSKKLAQVKAKQKKTAVVAKKTVKKSIKK